MTDQTTQTPDTTTATPAADAPLPPELQYLKDHGEDITEFLPKPAETAPAATPTATTEPSPKGEDEEPGEVTVGTDGRIHDPKTGRFVPKAAYTRQRDRATTAETELQTLRQQLAAANAKLEVGAKPAAPAIDPKKANPFEEADIDPAADIVGWAQQVAKRQKWQVEQQIKATQETTAALTEQGVTQAYKEDTQRFVARQLDYPKAYEHVVRGRLAELIAMGVTDKAELTKQVREDEADIVRQAIAGGKSPAQVFYALAVAKGYQAPTAQPNPAPAAAAPSGVQPAAKTTAQQIIENIQAGQEAGKTLTGAGSGAGTPGLTVDQYLSMEPDAIIKLRSTPQGMAQLKAIGAA